jgi:hypothetical protein
MRTKTCNAVLRPNEEMGVGEEHYSSFSVTFSSFESLTIKGVIIAGRVLYIELKYVGLEHAKISRYVTKK